MPPQVPLIAQIVEMDVSTLPAGELRIPLHLHHFHQLDIILGGQVTIGINGVHEISGARGTTVLIPPLCRHSYHSQQGFSQVSFKLHLSPRHWELFGRQHRSVLLPQYRLGEVEDFARRWSHEGQLLSHQGFSVATLCLLSVAEFPSEPESVSADDIQLAPRLWQLLEEIEARPYEAWSVAGLARSCHLSTDHFSRSFSQLLSTTPQKYLLEARMRSVAAELVNHSSRPIKQIAETAGYTTVHAFSRAFKGVFGLAPAAYRNAPRQL